MAELLDPASGSNGVGLPRDSRRSLRRKTFASIVPLEGATITDDAKVLNLSVSGAFIRTKNPPPVGSRFVVEIKLPTGSNRPIRVGAQVVRVDEDGIGVVFEELQNRDRTLIRGYATFLDLDDAIVTLQSSIPHELVGNLLPISDKELIAERLHEASTREARVLIALSARPGALIEARLDYTSNILRLGRLEKPLPNQTNVIYCAMQDGPLHAVFEGLITGNGMQPTLLFPERLYHNDRRCSRRVLAKDTWLSIYAPHQSEGTIRVPVVDASEGGCAVLAPKNSLVTVGTRFPVVELTDGQKTIRHGGATITRIVPSEQPDYWLLGLNFIDAAAERDAFSQIQKRTVQTRPWAYLQRAAGIVREKAEQWLGLTTAANQSQVYVCQYKNTRREQVVGILDATFDLHHAAPPVDVAILIAQPFQVRKEVFNLLARTLVDNFRRDGLNGVILRFDMTHMIGESHSDPEPEGDAAYFYNWTYSTFESDMIGSLAYLARRFQPAKRVLVSFSVAAIPARRLIADGEKPGVDLWVAPFGCPDGQDQFKFLTAGVDLFHKCRAGEKLEPIYIYGRRGDVNGVVGDAIRRKMGFLEEARQDISKIDIPICWILGKYDFVVTRERVRQMLNAPGQGSREIIELPSGHLLKTGPEAIESYKLIYEIIAKHLFCVDRPAAEPDMARFVKQSEAEWARVKRTRIKNKIEFWDRHLFGDSAEVEGYDMFLYNPDYMQMMETQAEMLDIRPGDKIADLGCGTGNLSLALLKNLSLNGQSVSLACCDLVPKGVQRTKEKIEEAIRQAGERLNNLHLDFRVLDLEGARLAPLQEFLSGKLYGPVALAGRIEGLETPTLRKIAVNYGSRLHEILHGSLSNIKEIMRLCPSLDETEAEIVLELSMASRFLKDQVLPADLRPERPEARHTGDLNFQHLYFGYVTRSCRIDCPSESFNKIGASIVLPYLYDPESAAREFYRLLAPGGVIVLSSPKPNFDSSKSYIEETQSIAQRADLEEKEKARLLRSLGELAAFVSHVLEMEEEGRFRFFAPHELADLMQRAGFDNIRMVETLGDPPTAVIVRAEKVK